MEYKGASWDHPSGETIAIAAHAIYWRPGRDAYNKLDMKATNTGRYNFVAWIIVYQQVLSANEKCILTTNNSHYNK